MLRDGFSRIIDYLRLSVTDRCNLRCVYCLPETSARFLAGPDVLSDDEIVELVACFAQLGVAKVRITGGEPLVRPRLAGLIQKLSSIPGIADLSLSTNAVLLSQQAQALKQAGLGRVNISLDSLDSGKFAQITRSGSLKQVLEGIDAALDAGLAPVKLNVVVARGMNDDEIEKFVLLTETKPLHVRFIELMPMGETGFFNSARWIALDEIMAKAGPLEAVSAQERPTGYGPARYFKRRGAVGTVGFISALSCGFCATCNRVRMTASGVMVACLDGVDGLDLRAPLRSGVGRARLKELIREAVKSKPEGHFMNARLSAATANPRFMCQIGG